MHYNIASVMATAYMELHTGLGIRGGSHESAAMPGIPEPNPFWVFLKTWRV